MAAAAAAHGPLGSLHAGAAGSGSFSAGGGGGGGGGAGGAGGALAAQVFTTPPELLCPITQELLWDPVLTTSGQVRRPHVGGAASARGGRRPMRRTVLPRCTPHPHNSRNSRAPQRDRYTSAPRSRRTSRAPRRRARR
jgi:hypothetical protein